MSRGNRTRPSNPQPPSTGSDPSRFGSRSGLIRALLDERERALQDALLRGPPPLGPGAPARERLDAFLDALTELTLEHADLLVAADGAGGRYGTGAYAAWHQHVAVLLGELRPDDDPALLAHLVLAPLAPDLVRHLTREVGASGERVRGEVRALAARVTA